MSKKDVEKDKGRGVDPAPAAAPAAAATGSPDPPSPVTPPPAAPPATGAPTTAETVIKDVTLAALATAGLGALVALATTQAGRETAGNIGAVVLETGTEAWGQLGDPQGPAARTLEEFAVWAEREADNIDRATEREDVLRARQTGFFGIFGNLFGATPLVVTAHADGRPDPVHPATPPRTRYITWPWTRTR